MNRYDDDHRRILLEVATESIAHGLQHHQAIPLDVSTYPQLLREHRASFVTLRRASELRGCIGGLEPHRPLVMDVAEHAYAAAFNDPRFAALTPSEFNDLQVHISVLGPSEPIHFDDEEDLLGQLRPKVDGLVLEEPQLGQRGTFLPDVWQSLPEPKQFLGQLKKKAGLPGDYWSATIRVHRYTTESLE